MQDNQELISSFEEDSQDQLLERRIIFLGDSGAGKSSIVFRMTNDGADLRHFHDMPTPGLAVHQLERPLDSTRRMRFHIWDFSGDSVYHGLYQMFMADAALYVIVLDAGQGNLNRQASRWLGIVRRYAGDAPVVLVVNKLDQDPGAPIDKDELIRSYPQITHICMIAARTFSKQEFETSVAGRILFNMSWMASFTPTSPACRALQQALQRRHPLEMPYISLDAYMELCQQHGINDPDACRILLEQLLRQGSCIRFHILDSQEILILDPTWITNAFHCIAHSCRYTNRNGFISLDDIRGSLTHEHYTSSDILMLLNVLIEYSVALQISRNTCFFPSLCSADRLPVMQAYLNDPGVQVFILEYDCPTADILYKLMAKLVRNLDKENLSRSVCIFAWPEDGYSAVVEADDRILNILVRSTGEVGPARMCLDYIRTQLREVHEHLSLKEPKVYVAYRENGTTEWFPYDELLSMSRHGTESTYSSVSQRLIPIRNILDHIDNFNHRATKNLCTDIAKILNRMAEHPGLRRTHEDDLNMTLRDHLDILGYHIAAQGRLKARNDRGGIHEADVVLMNDDRTPWTVIEALRVRDGNVRYWNDHLRKLLVYYTPFDLPVRFLISYVECERNRYPVLMNRYLQNIHRFAPDECELLPYAIRREVVAPDLYVISSVYLINGRPVTVYHYFVLMHGESRSLPDDLEIWTKEFEAAVAEANADAKPEDTPPPLPEAADAQPTEADGEEDPPPLSLMENQTQDPPQAPQADPPAGTETDTAQDKNTPPSSTEYRVVLLGDGEAGKSLVLHRLKHPDCDPAEFPGNVTPGIDIASKEYSLKKKNVRVNYWDFGGQEVLHPLHRMFLVRQTLYVILLNTRNDNQDERAVFWLRFVQTYAAGAPVVLVLNKVDQNPQAALNEQLLMEQFPNIRAILPLSALTWSADEFRDNFEKKLTDQIELLLTERNTFSGPEMEIIREIRSKKSGSKQVSLKEFRQICMKSDPGKATQYIDLLNRFNAVGICVFFEEKTETQTQMLLDPEWITTAIYKILEMRNELKGNGIVSHDDIGTLFDSDPSGEYGREDVGFVLNVMRTFQLSYPRPNQKEEFIPMLCRHSEPEDVQAFIADSHTREMQLRYEYLPSDVLYRLIVGRSKELDQNKVWRFGAVFNHSDNCSAVIRRDGDTLTLCTGLMRPAAQQEALESDEATDSSAAAVPVKNASEAAEYMGALLGDIQKGAVMDKSGRIPGADNGICAGRIRERLIGYKYEDQKEFFDYDRLNLSKEKQLYYVMSKCRQMPVYIQDILDQVDTSAEREKDELLKLTLAGCMDIQKDKLFWKVNEDTRNRQLMRRISQQFHTLDQTQGGESGSGNSTGELDGEIRLEQDLPWVILEALNIKNDFTQSANNWEFHLSKLIENYNTSGYRYLLLISYVECAADHFGECQNYYFDKLFYGIPGDSWERPTLCKAKFIKGCPQMISVTQADYERNNATTTVYHFMVHIPGHTPKKRTPRKKKTVASESNPQTDPAKDTAAGAVS